MRSTSQCVRRQLLLSGTICPPHFFETMLKSKEKVIVNSESDVQHEIGDEADWEEQYIRERDPLPSPNLEVTSHLTGKISREI